MIEDTAALELLRTISRYSGHCLFLMPDVEYTNGEKRDVWLVVYYDQQDSAVAKRDTPLEAVLAAIKELTRRELDGEREV